MGKTEKQIFGIWEELRDDFRGLIPLLFQSSVYVTEWGKEIFQGTPIPEMIMKRIDYADPPRVIASDKQKYMDGPKKAKNDWNDDWFKKMEIRLPEDEDAGALPAGTEIPMAGCYCPAEHTVVLYPVWERNPDEATIVHELFHAFHYSVMHESAAWHSARGNNVRIVRESLADYYTYMWCLKKGRFEEADRLIASWYRYRHTDWPYRYALYFLKDGTGEGFRKTLVYSSTFPAVDVVKSIKSL